MERFFATLGPARAAALTHVSADGADWIGDVVAEYAPQALRCLDPFHAVGWVTDALDEVRRQVWNQLRGGKGQTTPESKAFKNARWALWKWGDRQGPHIWSTMAALKETSYARQPRVSGRVCTRVSPRGNPTNQEPVYTRDRMLTDRTRDEAVGVGLVGIGATAVDDRRSRDGLACGVYRTDGTHSE